MFPPGELLITGLFSVANVFLTTGPLVDDAKKVVASAVVVQAEEPDADQPAEKTEKSQTRQLRIRAEKQEREGGTKTVPLIEAKPGRIEVRVIHSESGDKAENPQATDDVTEDFQNEVRELRKKLVDAIRNDRPDEAEETKKRLLNAMKRQAEQQQNPGHEMRVIEVRRSSEDPSGEVIVVEEERVIRAAGETPAKRLPEIAEAQRAQLLKRRAELEAREKHQNEIAHHEQEMANHRREQERREREQMEREQMERRRHEAGHEPRHEGDSPDQMMRRIHALHEAAERLQQGGLQDMAHQLRQQAAEMERMFDRMQHRNGGPDHPPVEAIHHLSEQIEQLRGEVRELHEKLERLTNMLGEPRTR